MKNAIITLIPLVGFVAAAPPLPDGSFPPTPEGAPMYCNVPAQSFRPPAGKNCENRPECANVKCTMELKMVKAPCCCSLVEVWNECGRCCPDNVQYYHDATCDFTTCEGGVEPTEYLGNDGTGMFPADFEGFLETGGEPAMTGVIGTAESAEAGAGGGIIGTGVSEEAGNNGGVIGSAVSAERGSHGGIIGTGVSGTFDKTTKGVIGSAVSAQRGSHGGIIGTGVSGTFDKSKGVIGTAESAEAGSGGGVIGSAVSAEADGTYREVTSNGSGVSSSISYDGEDCDENGVPRHPYWRGSSWSRKTTGSSRKYSGGKGYDTKKKEEDCDEEEKTKTYTPPKGYTPPPAPAY